MQILAQNDANFKVEAKSAFVWGKDTRYGAVSSIIEDPLTGRDIFQLSYGGVNVTSRMGFDWIANGRTGEFLEYATTVVNNTGAGVSVRYGGISVDGFIATPPVVGSGRKTTMHRERTGTVGLNALTCFRSGFLGSEKMFSAGHLTDVATVAPGTALTVSSLAEDPRNYSVRCSLNGCYPTGTVRYYVTVAGHDFVFVWPGSSVAYCGR